MPHRSPSDEMVALAIINRNIVFVSKQLRRMEARMTQEFEELKAAADANTAAVAAIAEDVTQVIAKLDELEAQIAAGNPVTAEQIAEVTAQLTAATESLTASDTALDAETGGTPPAPEPV